MTQSLPPETELIPLLCRTPVRENHRARIAALVERGLDWNALLRHAAGWEVEAVVCSNLRGEFGGAMPASALAVVAAKELETRALTLAKTLLTVKLSGKLEAIGITTLVLKGPAVGIAAYGDPSLRSFADIDFLVKREDLVRARVQLVSLGYTPDYAIEDERGLSEAQHALEFSDGRTKVELHWVLLSRHLRFDIPPAELWERAVRIPCAGGSIGVLAPEHLFIFLCAHGAKHEWERPRWICDVAQLLERVAPEVLPRILAVAAGSHSKRILALALRLSRDMFAVSDLRFEERDLEPESDTITLIQTVRRHVSLFETHDDFNPGVLARLHPGLGTLLFWARARERLTDRVACAARLIFVPTVADEGARGLRWARRPLRLAARVIRRPRVA